MITLKKTLLLSTCLLTSVSLHAGTVICSGTIKSLRYHANNNFLIQLDSMNKAVYFCSPDSEWNVSGTPYKTGPETCKTLYSTFLAAKLAGKQISSMYFDGDQVPASCNGWSDWNRANIRYFVLED